jgi:hypothetical protein
MCLSINSSFWMHIGMRCHLPDAVDIAALGMAYIAMLCSYSTGCFKSIA